MNQQLLRKRLLKELYDAYHWAVEADNIVDGTDCHRLIRFIRVFLNTEFPDEIEWDYEGDNYN